MSDIQMTDVHGGQPVPDGPPPAGAPTLLDADMEDLAARLLSTAKFTDATHIPAAQPTVVANKPKVYSGSDKDPPAAEWLGSVESYLLASKLVPADWAINALTLCSPELQTLLKSGIDASYFATMSWSDFTARFTAIAAAVGKGQSDVDLLIRCMLQRPDVRNPRKTFDTLHHIDALIGNMTCKTELSDVVKIAIVCKAIHPEL